MVGPQECSSNTGDLYEPEQEIVRQRPSKRHDDMMIANKNAASGGEEGRRVARRGFLLRTSSDWTTQAFLCPCDAPKRWLPRHGHEEFRSDRDGMSLRKVRLGREVIHVKAGAQMRNITLERLTSLQKESISAKTNSLEEPFGGKRTLATLRTTSS